MPKLENWSVNYLPSNNPYHPPELGIIALSGTVYNHSRLDDGKYISTSPILDLEIKNNFARTKNTIYELGEPDEKFVQWLESTGHRLEDYDDEVSN